MYTSWFKNEQDTDEENHLPPSDSSNAGTVWFLAMFVTAFMLVGLAIFIPDPGISIALYSFPLATIIFTLWLLRLLSII
jgi:hypothetical protein